MKVLVTGGAGYIGSFMARRLLDDGYSVTVVDSIERGHLEYVDSRATFKKGDLLEKNFVDSLFEGDPYDGIIHFAGYISVGESMEKPYMYFQNNVFSVMNLLEGMKKNRSNNFIFSSTAGVYGNPKALPIPENHEKNPESPYGESKLMAERVLHWYAKSSGIHSICLRYFNASGADLEGKYGENHAPETHIIPNAMNAAFQNKSFTLFGDDYNTDDGTCVRDYIHVLDLVEAHVLGLKKLQSEGGVYQFNVGTGVGYSNKQVLEMVKKVTGIDFQIQVEKRRIGDADKLIADATRIKEVLGFTPKHSDLETIVSSAYNWHKNKQT